MPYYNTAMHKRLQRVLCRPCSYTTNGAKQHTGLYRGFSGHLPHSTAANTRPTRTDITSPATRWSISQHRSTSSTYQIPEPRRTLCRPVQPPYYNKVYKGAPPVMDPCQPVQYITDHASPSGSRCFPRLALAWHRVSLALCFLPGTAARNH